MPRGCDRDVVSGWAEFVVYVVNHLWGYSPTETTEFMDGPLACTLSVTFGELHHHHALYVLLFMYFILFKFIYYIK